MYKTVLVKQLIEDGAKLLERLDKIGFPIQAAVWFYDPEKMSWKLVVVSSVAGDPGPLEAFMRIQVAMNGPDLSLSLDDIIVMSPASRKFEEFKRTMEGVARGALLSPRVSPEGVVFDDAYVYRWQE
ncbi:MAG: hypothetical protein WAM43_20445 [Terriglobales bacterium]